MNMSNLIRIISLVMVILSISYTAQAGELEQAYQKEYAYLVAEKKALEQRLVKLSESQEKTLDSLQGDIDTLQKRYLKKKNNVDRLNQDIIAASRDVDFNENDKLLVETTLIQARSSLSKLGVDLDETMDADKQLLAAFESASLTLSSDSAITKQLTTYFDVTGKEVKGEVLNVGRIARYGMDEIHGGVLVPSGSGKFKVWDAESANTIEAVSSNADNVSIFLFDNVDVAIEKQDEKGFGDDLKAGGMIGKVILILGLVGLALVALRIVFLLMLGSDTQKITVQVNGLVKNEGVQAALDSCKKNASSASRVISATLRNIKKERDHIEDIISEAILFEASKIDRFGSAILVIAAVSPLLGLLGTVTGMISTFDIITEFGTGDPKLLSTGISEALVTTKFGLIVAIPLLLIGNLLSSWASRTKNGLERAALNVINTHKESTIA
jgi:biopolymer transport protein ExbB